MNPIGRVLGRRPSAPLEFYVAVSAGEVLALDDVIHCSEEVPEKGRVSFYGVVESVEKIHEGLTFDSDVELVEQGILPVETAYVGKVMTTRVEPELFIPPQPGTPVYRATGSQLDTALYFDCMKHKLAAGLMRNGEVAYLNYDFLCGVKGAHINISGISGVATKTSYALFLLYSLFHNDQMAQEVANSHTVIFNVKGEDLLYLDLPNSEIKPEDRLVYQRLGLPCQPFQSVAFYAPPKSGSTLIPDVVRMQGVTSFVWTLREFAEQGLFRFLFADAGQGTSQLEFAVERVSHILQREARQNPGQELVCHGVRIRSLEHLADLLSEAVDEEHSDWFGKVAMGTKQAMVRRLQAAVRYIEPMIRSSVDQPEKHRFNYETRQVTVVDIHKLHTRAKSFVVGAVLNTLFERKEAQASPFPRVYVVLDELNKYAPRHGWNPIKDILLDVAERGRSLGIVLVGAEQTASEVEERIVSNAAFRVTGRLDAAESQKPSYGWLAGTYRLRASIIKPGSMIVHQPELPSPLMISFPFPAWATRPEEVAQDLEAARSELDGLLNF
ncbi:ATP-binding protein [bacterium]|nr:ATP-binding protein [bacterium]